MSTQASDRTRGLRIADERVLEAIFNPEEPAGSAIECVDDSTINGTDVPDSAEVSRAKELELSAVKEAEGGRLQAALELLTEAIAVAPDFPSPYNNRAQVYRLQNEVDLALQDLDNAVTLSGGRGLAAEQAFAQRGLIHRLRGNDEQAKADFQAAAKLGSKFAHKQLVQMNPYAALCGQMLSEAFDKLRKGEQT